MSNSANHNSQTDIDNTVSGFLLSRQWRDTANGLELNYWASTDIGPLLIKVTGQQAVCFCERSHVIVDAPANMQRRPLELITPDHAAVDGLYFHSQRELRQFSEHTPKLFESDVNPANRYLMERFLQAGFDLKGEIQAKGRYSVALNPRIAPAEVNPVLSAASLDIETNGFTDDLYSIAVAHPKESVVFMRGASKANKDSQHPRYSLRFFDNEASLLRAFLSWFRQLDPDLIIGWNVIGFDLVFLQRKCTQLDIPFAIGRGNENAYIQPRGDNKRMIQAPARARIPGRATLDGIELLRAGFWSFESFALDNVASELLGKKKTIALTGKQKVEEINRQFRSDKQQLADYNIQDCFLVQEIFEHADLFNFAIKRAQMTGLDIDRMGGSVATFDNLYLPRLHRQGGVAPDVNTDRDSGLGSPGGYVLDSQPGIYRNVLVLDFKSLYPSIIRTFLIDPLGLHQASLSAKPVEGFLGASFSREQSILPDLVGELWRQRDMAKTSNDAALSQAIKIIMNSLYGVLGTPACRFYDPKLASSITLRGHQIITETRTLIEELGFRVIYGDTDSLFVLLNEDIDEDTAKQQGQTLAESLNSHWQETLRKDFDLPCFLELEFETHYLRFLMPTIRGETTGSKKRYAGLIRNRQGDVEVQFKGLEAARTDWTPLAREFQRELYTRVFTDCDYSDWLIQTADALLQGKLDDKLVYRKRLRRPIDDYQKNVPPHVRAARKLDSVGSHIEYMITLSGPEPIEKLESAPDYQHYLDRQLAPAADGLLNFLGTSFAELTSNQITMF